jgi:hypothetical protein
MKLTELNPEWLSSGGEGVSYKDGNAVPFVEKAAIKFDCPDRCGTEVVIPFSEGYGGSHWTMSGTGFNDLTLNPSIKRVEGCGSHFFVKNGEITDLTHN